jgi:hypothetical protein
MSVKITNELIDVYKSFAEQQYQTKKAYQINIKNRY